MEDPEMPDSMKSAALLLISIVFLSLPAGVRAQEPTSREYPYIYKSPRAMGMGGANTAVGGRVDSLFYNPAGLINIPQDKGLEVNLLSVSAEYSKKSQKFLKEIQDADKTGDLNQDGSTDDDRLRAANDVLANYRGSNLHARAADFTSIGKSYDRFAYGVGAIGTGRLDAVAHQGFGADGFLELNADAFYGTVAGASYGVTDNVFAGVALKYLHRESVIHSFTAREVVENQDKLGDYIQDNIRTRGDAVGADAGVIWKFAQDSPLNPSFGASIMNIGGLHFGRAGSLPMSVNAGFSVNPAISTFRSLIVAVDYIDLLNNYKQDKDAMKRLRYGAELQLFDIWQAEMALRAGMYDNYPTLGADLRLFVFTFSYVMYTEEVGAFAGQDKDKRQLLTLNIGW
jgi:hypothetical protein